MPKDIPRLQWFGGDTRSSVWLGFAQLLMPKEYDRVEAIRRHRRELKMKARIEAEAAAAKAIAPGDAGDDQARSAVGEQTRDTGPEPFRSLTQETQHAERELNLNLNQTNPQQRIRAMAQQVSTPDAARALSVTRSPASKSRRQSSR